MGRRYDSKVYPRIPTNSLEDARHIHPGVHRFDESQLYDDEYKSCDV